MKFRKKPIVIDAEQFLLDTNVLPFRDQHVCCFGSDSAPDRWYVLTLEGPLTISDGDWIIRGIAGEFYPCKPDIFAATYEPVEAAEGEQ